MTGNAALRRYGPWAALLIAAAAYYPRFAKDTVGMIVYPQAGGCVLQGASLRTCAEPFSYPPAFALPMAPFALMPMGARVAVWYVISIAATVGCFALSEKLVRRLPLGQWCETELVWLRVAAIIASSKFVLAVYEYQAYDILALLIVLAGLWALAERRALLSGAVLALATAIKATPLVFLPYLVVKRRYLAAAVFVVVLVVLSLLPDGYAALKGTHPHYLQTWLGQIAGPALAHRSNDTVSFWDAWMGANNLNHSFRGMVARLVAGTSAQSHAEQILRAISAVYIAAVGLLLLRSARRDGLIAVDGSILAISMLVLSPMTSRYHYILLLLPYMTVIAIAIKEPRLRIAASLAAGASFVMATAMSNDLSGQWLTEWSYAHNFLIYSALVLFVFLAWCILRREPAAAAA